MDSAATAKVLQARLNLENPLVPHRLPLPGLTGIRFFAAFYVVLFHSHFAVAMQQRGFSMVARLVSNGGQAVVLFFLLSGFILSYTYQGRIAQGKGRIRFWEARVSRVWPVYLLSLLLSTLFNHTTPSWQQMIATLLMVQAWNPFNVQEAGAWSFVCWTLSTEALFYLIFPFVQYRLEMLSSRGQRTSLLVVLLLSIGLGTSLHGFGSQAGHFWHHIPLALIHVPEFIAGMLLGNLYNGSLRPDGKSWWAGRGYFLTALGCVSSLAVLSSEGTLALRFTTATFAILLFGLAGEESTIQRFLAAPLLIFGGQISYSLYLLQWPIKYAAKDIFMRLSIPGEGTQFAVYCVLLSVVSWLSFRAIEEPARQLMNSAFLWRERRPKP